MVKELLTFNNDGREEVAGGRKRAAGPDKAPAAKKRTTKQANKTNPSAPTLAKAAGPELMKPFRSDPVAKAAAAKAAAEKAAAAKAAAEKAAAVAEHEQKVRAAEAESKAARAKKSSQLTKEGDDDSLTITSKDQDEEPQMNGTSSDQSYPTGLSGGSNAGHAGGVVSHSSESGGRSQQSGTTHAATSDMTSRSALCLHMEQSNQRELPKNTEKRIMQEARTSLFHKVKFFQTRKKTDKEATVRSFLERESGVALTSQDWSELRSKVSKVINNKRSTVIGAAQTHVTGVLHLWHHPCSLTNLKSNPVPSFDVFFSRTHVKRKRKMLAFQAGGFQDVGNRK